MGTVKPCVVRSDATCFPGHPLQPWVQGDVALCCGTELAQTQRLLLGTMSIRLLQQQRQRSVNSDASAWSRDPRGRCGSFPDRVPCAAVSSVPVASHHGVHIARTYSSLSRPQEKNVHRLVCGRDTGCRGNADSEPAGRKGRRLSECVWLHHGEP